MSFYLNIVCKNIVSDVGLCKITKTFLIGFGILFQTINLNRYNKEFTPVGSIV